MIWVADWNRGGLLVWARSIEDDKYHWPSRWYFVDAIVRGAATATTNTPKPQLSTTVTDIRGLTQDDYDLLIAEERARAALGE